MTKSRTLRRAGAVVLSLAMAVSPLFIAPNSLAASNPKLSKTSVSVYVGKKKTIKIKLTKAQKKQLKSVSVKMTSAQKKKAKVSASKKTLKVTITGKKKGTVKNAKVVLKFKKKVNKKKTWTLKIKKITVKKKTTPTATPTVAPASAEMTVKNAISGYENTVLQNVQALVQVKALQEGKPIANTTVTLAKTGGTGKAAAYSVLGQNVQNTDANGIATFVVGVTTPPADFKSTTAGYVASVNLTATVAATGAEIKGHADFAKIGIKRVSVLNNGVAYPALVRGTNSVAAKNEGVADTTQIYNIAPMDAPAGGAGNLNQYVATQQVSASGVDHAVRFGGGVPTITLPTVQGSDTKAEKLVEPVDFTSEKYHTYTNASSLTRAAGEQGADTQPTDYKLINLTQDVKDLTYATVQFTNIKLSKYSRLVIETWKDASKAEGAAYDASYCVKHEVYGSDDAHTENGTIGYQISKTQTATAGKWAVKAYIVSAGQVDTSKNDGYTIKDITYVFNGATTGVAGSEVPLAGASINWSAVDTLYTSETDLTYTDVNTDGLGIGDTYKLGDKVLVTLTDANKTISKVTYKVPVFPYTGTAILTGYDANGSVVGYWAIPVKNSGTNTNIVDTTEAAYPISSDEVKDKVGTVTTADNIVTVDSTVAGRTTLEGKISGVDIEGLDANTNTVYTSVQWNPIPKAAAETAKGSVFVALIGQSIELEAQLMDRDKVNKVKEPNAAITFKYGDSSVANEDTKVGTASITKKVFTTDTDGKAYLTLNSSEVETLVNMSVSTESNYNVALYIKGTQVDKADLYWIDADLAFKKNPTAEVEKTASTAGQMSKTISTGITPTAGETWEYGVYAVPTYDDDANGGLHEDTLNLDGLTIKMTKESGDATVKDVKNGTVEVSATKSGTVSISSKLAPTSTDVITFTTAGGTPVVYAGVGTTNISKTIIVEPEYGVGFTYGEWVDIAPVKTAADNWTFFFRLKDENGNPIKNKKVKTVLDEDSSKLGPSSDIDGTTGQEVTTNPTGIAAFKVARGNVDKNAMTATVEGLDGKEFTKTITWDDVAANVFVGDIAPDGDVYKTNYNKTEGRLDLYMTQSVYAASVVKEQFTVTYTSQGNTVTWEPTAVAVEGKKISLTVPKLDNLDAAGIININYKDATVKGITYRLASTEGVAVTDDTNYTFNPNNKNNVEKVNGSNTNDDSNFESAAAGANRAKDNEIITAVANALKASAGDLSHGSVDDDTLTFKTITDFTAETTGKVGTISLNWTFTPATPDNWDTSDATKIVSKTAADSGTLKCVISSDTLGTTSKTVTFSIASSDALAISGHTSGTVS